MKKILLPTDFSDNSKNAISYALNFYKDDICEFTLLNAYQVNEYEQNNIFIPIPSDAFMQQKKKNSEKNLSILIQEIKMRYPNTNHTFRKVSQNQPLVDLLKREVREYSYDLIVIGTQGITNLKDVAYGTNTIHILEDVTNCPIFAIPSHVKFSKIKEIVLATGFKTVPQPKEFFFIKELIRKTSAELRILNIAEMGGLSAQQEKNKRVLIQILDDVAYTFHSLAHVSVPIGIYCFTESRGSDMITFINKKHSFFQNVLFNPLYKNLGNYSKIPVLIIQTSEKSNLKNC